MKHGWRGYISSRRINGEFIPQRVQNLVIREYVQKKGKDFLLSHTEYIMPESFMMLKGMILEFVKLEAVVFYSLNQLPSNKQFRQTIYRELVNSHCEIHFALEELVVRQIEEAQIIEDIFLVKSLSEYHPLVRL